MRFDYTRDGCWLDLNDDMLPEFTVYRDDYFGVVIAADYEPGGYRYYVTSQGYHQGLWHLGFGLLLIELLLLVAVGCRISWLRRRWFR